MAPVAFIDKKSTTGKASAPSKLTNSSPFDFDEVDSDFDDAAAVPKRPKTAAAASVAFDDTGFDYDEPAAAAPKRPKAAAAARPARTDRESDTPRPSKPKIAPAQQRAAPPEVPPPVMPPPVMPPPVVPPPVVSPPAVTPAAAPPSKPDAARAKKRKGRDVSEPRPLLEPAVTSRPRRERLRPLEFWAGERVVYERGEVCGVMLKS